MGKTLAFTTIKFFDDKDALVARGSHTKYVELGPESPKDSVCGTDHGQIHLERCESPTQSLHRSCDYKLGK